MNLHPIPSFANVLAREGCGRERFRFRELEKSGPDVETILRHTLFLVKAGKIFRANNSNNIKIQTTMNYALLAFQSQEQFESRDPAAAAAGKAYGEAQRAAGVLVTAAGLNAAKGSTSKVLNGKD
jgi:hypothetical protein